MGSGAKTHQKSVGSSAYYLHADHLGSVRMEKSGSGVTVFTTDYVPYGTKYWTSGSEVFSYTGKPYDNATGLYYFGARYYDPATGRFVTEDTLHGPETEPETLDRYIYASANPTTNVDLDGRSAMSAIHGIHTEWAGCGEGDSICRIGVATTEGAIAKLIQELEQRRKEAETSGGNHEPREPPVVRQPWLLSTRTPGYFSLHFDAGYSASYSTQPADVECSDSGCTWNGARWIESRWRPTLEWGDRWLEGVRADDPPEKYVPKPSIP